MRQVDQESGRNHTLQGGLDSEVRRVAASAAAFLRTGSSRLSDRALGGCQRRNRRDELPLDAARRQPDNGMHRRRAGRLLPGIERPFSHPRVRFQCTMDPCGPGAY